MKFGTRAVGIGVAAVVVAVALAALQTTRGHNQAASSATTPAPATFAVDTQRVAINVAGMYCANCETTVRTMLKRSPGVIAAEVNVDRGVALVTYDSARTTPAELAEVINRLGYKATLPRRG
jgi:mercuric ion binding protein